MTLLWAVVLAAPALATNGNTGWLGTLSWILIAFTLAAGIPWPRGGRAEVPPLRDRPGHQPDPGLAIVTGLLVGVYAGPVLLATRVLAVTSPVAVAAATLAAAALFSPLRSRVQLGRPPVQPVPL